MNTSASSTSGLDREPSETSVGSSVSGTTRGSVRPTRLLRLGVFALLMVSAGACADSLVEVGGELTLELSGPSSAALSDSVAVSYEARGRSLLGMVVSYGDGTVDSVFFVGSQSAGGRVAHLYDEAGSYTIVGEVQDGIEGSTTAQIVVQVTP